MLPKEIDQNTNKDKKFNINQHTYKNGKFILEIIFCFEKIVRINFLMQKKDRKQMTNFRNQKGGHFKYLCSSIDKVVNLQKL